MERRGVITERKRGPERDRREHDRIVDALRRGARVKWDTYEPFGSLRLPGSGETLSVHPWSVEAAFREIVGTAK